MKMRYIMRGFTSVVRLPLFLIVVFTISAAAQEQPENNQFNGLDYTLQNGDIRSFNSTTFKRDKEFE